MPNFGEKQGNHLNHFTDNDSSKEMIEVLVVWKLFEIFVKDSQELMMMMMRGRAFTAYYLNTSSKLEALQENF